MPEIRMRPELVSQFNYYKIISEFKHKSPVQRNFKQFPMPLGQKISKNFLEIPGGRFGQVVIGGGALGGGGGGGLGSGHNLSKVDK